MKKKMDLHAKLLQDRVKASALYVVVFFKDGSYMHTITAGTLPEGTTEPEMLKSLADAAEKAHAGQEGWIQ